MSKDTFGDRMKHYENVSKNSLMKKTPVIIRLDGKAFHTYTKQKIFKELDSPFSTLLKQCFTYAATNTIKHIQGARFAYLQSDEVSILLTDFKTITTDAWLKYSVQKMTSISASIFTYYFNRYTTDPDFAGAEIMPALFDARVFNLPMHEVENYFIWRQQDATRNSINMLGQYHFSHKQLHGKNTSAVQDMLMKEKNINWNDVDVCFKRGSTIVSHYANNDRLEYIIDAAPPIFTTDRKYITNHLS